MEPVAISGAEIYYEEHFLSSEEATTLFNTLLAKCAWERRKTSFKGSVPRDEAYYGDPGTNYTYSRSEYKPLAWIPELLSLKARVEEATPTEAYAKSNLSTVPYNAVLCNLYQNGHDSVGLHADAEPEMGPVIASVSLGVERCFALKGRMAGLPSQKNCRMGACSSWRGTHRKISSTRFPKNPISASRALT